MLALLFLFAVYYFTQYFTFRPAPLPRALLSGLRGLDGWALKEAAWIAYRESAKTSIAKIGLVWLIARKQVIDALREQW